MPDWIAILLRSAGLFFLVLIGVRLIGKGPLTRKTPFGLVNYAVIAVITSLLALDLTLRLSWGLVALIIWIILPVALELGAMKSRWVHDLVHGTEIVLVKQGKIMEKNMGRARITGPDLLRELRAKNVFSLADVEFAVLETTGEIDVMRKAEKNPLTAQDLGEKAPPREEPQTVIQDGNIVLEGLAAMGFNRNWLDIQLEKAGISLDNVFLGQADSSGEMYFDLFDDTVQIPQPKVKELLYAGLEKCRADLSAFALETSDPTARDMYLFNADKLERVLQRVEPYLIR